MVESFEIETQNREAQLTSELKKTRLLLEDTLKTNRMLM